MPEKGLFLHPGWGLEVCRPFSMHLRVAVGRDKGFDLLSPFKVPVGEHDLPAAQKSRGAVANGDHGAAV